MQGMIDASEKADTILVGNTHCQIKLVEGYPFNHFERPL